MSQTATMTPGAPAAGPVHQKSLSASSNLSVSASATSIGSSAHSTITTNQGTVGRGNQGTIGRHQGTLGRSASMSQRTLGRSGSGTTRETPQQMVDRLLKEAGVPRPEDKSKCLRQALAKGFYQLTGQIGELDQVVWQGKCVHCNAPGQHATLRVLLDQPDDGLDHAQGAPGAVVSCTQCEQSFYITGICTGRPERDTGKFHRHCADCPGLGACTQSENAQHLHCKKCNMHYDGGALGADACACAAQQACCVLA